ncbi:MAG TPA: hypothetical protein VNH16_25905 [Burkholderiales bacterium]|jgi:hypothetical protein|nr:hypothetical protein [Burkholderiales bacterium]
MAKTIILILLATLGGVPVAHAEDSAEDDQASFTQYATINFAERREVHRYYANAAALEAAKAGRPLPQGSVLLVKVYSAKLGSTNRPMMGCDGFLVADKLIASHTLAAEQVSGLVHDQ